MNCFGTYFTDAQTCAVTRVQSATQWTASVHTLHVPKPVMEPAFKVLRNELLWYILYRCPNLYCNPCSKCYAMNCFGTYFTHAQTCNVTVKRKSAVSWRQFQARRDVFAAESCWLHQIKNCRICKWGKCRPPKFEVSKRTWRKYYIINKLIYSSYGQFVVHLILCWNSWMFRYHWKRLLLHACFCVGNIQKLLRILSNPSLEPAVEHCYPKRIGLLLGGHVRISDYTFIVQSILGNPQSTTVLLKAWDPACLRDLPSWPARLLININHWFVDQIINSTISI